MPLRERSADDDACERDDERNALQHDARRRHREAGIRETNDYWPSVAVNVGMAPQSGAPLGPTVSDAVCPCRSMRKLSI